MIYSTLSRRHTKTCIASRRMGLLRKRRSKTCPPPSLNDCRNKRTAVLSPDPSQRENGNVQRRLRRYVANARALLTKTDMALSPLHCTRAAWLLRSPVVRTAYQGPQGSGLWSFRVRPKLPISEGEDIPFFGRQRRWYADSTNKIDIVHRLQPAFVSGSARPEKSDLYLAVILFDAC